MTQSQMKNDLEFLINRYIDGQATVDEVGQLSELLRTDVGSRRIFAEHMNIDSAIAEVAAGLPGKEAAIDDIIVLNRRAIYSNTIAYGVTGVAIAVICLAGVWYWHTVGQQGGDLSQAATSLHQAAVPEAVYPAVLIDEAGAEFAARMGPRKNNFSRGQYQLLSGVVQLRFETGAEVILNGPAKIEVIDSMHARVEYGKMRVIVPPTAKGFTVSTPAAEYIDLGTEFGLDVDGHAGTSDLYVLDGQVNVADKSSKRVIDEVTEGVSNRYVKGVSSPAPEFVVADFPTPNEIGFVRWQRHAERLVQDPSLIAFYSFRRTEHEAVLTNEVRQTREQGQSVSDGRIEGARWVSGRWPGKDALLFDGDQEFVELNILGKYNEMTIAAWLKIDRLDYEMNAILNSNLVDDGDVHFQITRQGLPKGGLQGAETTETFIGESLRIGRWVHVAMVISSSQRSRRVYANGELVREGHHDRDVEISPGMCRIANWLPSELFLSKSDRAPKRIRAFQGKMDELTIWDRALSKSELVPIAEAGRPNVDWQD